MILVAAALLNGYEAGESSDKPAAIHRPERAFTPYETGRPREPAPDRRKGDTPVHLHFDMWVNGIDFVENRCFADRLRIKDVKRVHNNKCRKHGIYRLLVR